MNCPSCGADNREGAAFCRNCGLLLGHACPRCGSAATTGANFCDACGYPLSPRGWAGAASGPLPAGSAPPGESSPSRLISASKPAASAPQAITLDRFIPRELLARLTATRGAGAERRVVTLLFCDIQGSTALAGQLDPEEWTEIVNGAFEQMVRPVYRYEGTVARLMGDGLLAFFGAPIAHEDDPRRAVLAGLAIVEGIHAYRRALPPAAADLDVRVGINTGLVVVGAVGSDLRLEYSAIGDAINLAARMEQAAVPGTVQIAEDTYRLIEGQFEVESLGGITVKGKEEPVLAYRVMRRAGGDARRAGALRSGLVNRRLEWETLERAFDALNDGRGGIFFLTGDAGLGKTRLIDEGVARLLPTLDTPGRFFEASAVSYETNQPYGMLIRLLRQPLGLLPGDPPERARERIAASVSSEEDAQLLETLFSVSSTANGHDLVGESFANRLDACLDRFWRAQSAGGPLILALDDLQWLDASSAARIARLFRLAESAAVLFLCALRRERRTPGWELKEAAGRDLPHRLTEAALHPLSDSESRALLAGLLGAAELPDFPAALILDKAEGNPLFLEEVVRHLVERGELTQSAAGPWSVAPEAAITLPDSIQALLTARVDRLEDATRRTLQVASVIGRHFQRATLAALVDDAAELDPQLLDLQRMELIREVSRLPEPDYQFSHTLIQEAVYHTILVRQRRAMHLHTAEVIESLRGADLRPVAPVLAHHFIEGGAAERALPSLLMAAGAALRLHATDEAIAHYDRALPIAIKLPGGTEQLVTICANRGRALELQSRFAEAKETYENMERLGQARGDAALELEAVIAQGKLYANVTPYYNAAHGRALMERAMSLARAAGDRVAEVRILWNLVNIDRFDLNSLDNAVVNGEKGIVLARELRLEEELAYLLNDVGDIYGSIGRFVEADDYLTEAQTRWRALGNEPMLADSLTNAAVLENIAGDMPGSLAKAGEAFAIASRIGNLWGQAYSQSVRGQIMGFAGEYGRAVEDLSAGHTKAGQANFIGGKLLSNVFLSRVFQELGSLDLAVERAQNALATGRAQLPQFASLALGRLALCLLAQGQLDAAIDLLDDPLVHEERLKVYVLYDITRTQIELALALEQERYTEVISLSDEAAARFAATGCLLWVPDIRFAGARALAAAGRLDEAAVALARCIARAREIGLRGTLWRYLEAAAAVEVERGNHETAAALMREAAAEIAYLLPRIWPDDLRDNFLARPEVARVRAAAPG